MKTEAGSYQLVSSELLVHGVKLTLPTSDMLPHSITEQNDFSFVTMTITRCRLLITVDHLVIIIPQQKQLYM